MLNYKNLKTCFGLSGILISACQPLYQVGPTAPTEAALVANAIGNGFSTELDIPYEMAFQNLKTAYRVCIAFTRDEALLFMDNKLDSQLEMGTLFGRSDHKAYVFKTTVEKLRNNKTLFTLYLPPKYPFPKTRFKQDIQRAMGKDKSCKA